LKSLDGTPRRKCWRERLFNVIFIAERIVLDRSVQMKRIARFTCLIIGLMLFQSKAFAWGGAGHQLIAAEVARGISEMLPDNSWGWIHWAYSLHELKRTKEAQGVLLPVADKFPDEYMIQYNLACYACQLGELKEALQGLVKAIDCAGEEDVRQMALDDPDLEPLWNQLSKI